MAEYLFIENTCKMTPRSLQDLAAMKVAQCVNDFRDIEPKLQYELPSSIVRLVERAWLYDLIKDSNAHVHQMMRYIFLNPMPARMDIYNMPGYGVINYLRRMTDGLVNKMYLSKLHHVEQGWCNVYCNTAKLNVRRRREEKKRLRRIMFNQYYYISN